MDKTSIKQIGWNEARCKVKSLNIGLCEIIDEIQPDIPLYELKYRYGLTISDDKHLYLPDGRGGIINKDVEDFPYFINIGSNLESFLITPEKNVPDTIYAPGVIFPKTMDVYDFEPNGYKYKPEAPFSLISGIRNLVVTSLSGNTSGYKNLIGEYSISREIIPSDPSYHFDIVKAVCDKKNHDWHSTLYMLDEKWIKNIHNNPTWWKLKDYLYRQSISTNMQRSNTIYLDYALTEIISENDLYLKPYSIECIKQIFNISTGGVTGFRIATGESGMPLKDIMTGIDQGSNPLSLPIIAETATINDKDNSGLIYLSIEATNNNLHEKKTLRPTYYLNEIIKNIDTVLNGLSIHPLTSENIYGQMKSRLKLGFYSEQGGKNTNSKILPASKLYDYDLNIKKIFNDYNEINNEDKRKMGVKSAFTKALISIEIK